MGTPPKAKETRYRLAPGTQVREEDFGLLFYTMQGPRLYFFASGDLLDSDFFQGDLGLDRWIDQGTDCRSVSQARRSGLRKGLHALQAKGVLLEC
jgi:putative mycofactocin binding protein MftB